MPMDNDDKNKWCRERDFEYFKHVTTLFTAVGLLYATIADKQSFFFLTSLLIHILVFGNITLGILMSLYGMRQCCSLISDLNTLPVWRVQIMLAVAIGIGGMGLIASKKGDEPKQNQAAAISATSSTGTSKP